MLKFWSDAVDLKLVHLTQDSVSRSAALDVQDSANMLRFAPFSPQAGKSDSEHAMMRLVHTVQQLSLARNMEEIMRIVRRAARELTGADGATFVLRDREFCFYADEDAIAPLWKGQRFPLERCISGWAMIHRQPAVIEDIYADSRIPADAYRPTFVKSLAMVPIRTVSPIGAIGNYWARRRQPTAGEIELLQALANTTSVAMENVMLLNDLEQRVADRTARLEAANLRLQNANRELECFAHAAAHDLGAPLRGISGFAELLRKESEANLSEKGKSHLQRVETAAGQMRELIDDLLRLSRVATGGLNLENVDVSCLAEEIASNFRANSPERKAEIRIVPGLEVKADRGLLRIVMENLLSNAWKYSCKRELAVIELNAETREAGAVTVSIRDNGIGFEQAKAEQLFQPFQRLHSRSEFPGTGVGLTTVKRIVERHGGKVWIEGEPGKGAMARFTLPK